MTLGAAASLSICFKALACKDDEFIAFAPFFPEYRCFVEATGAKLVVVSANTESFQINFNEQWEDKVVERILHNLSLLFDKKFHTVQELNRYRKQINSAQAS